MNKATVKAWAIRVLFALFAAPGLAALLATIVAGSTSTVDGANGYAFVYIVLIFPIPMFLALLVVEQNIIRKVLGALAALGWFPLGRELFYILLLELH